jgi:hypothetical protein
MELTHRWLDRCFARFNETEPLYGYTQNLFPIVQGGTFEALRKASCAYISEKDATGYAIGGLSVGEPVEMIYEFCALSCAHLPEQKPRYLMGVGTPWDLLECISAGVDMFDCVMPTRNGRNAMLFTTNGVINIDNKKWEYDYSAIDEGLQNEFMRLRFNQLPNNLITKFLKNISVQENLHLSDETILNIQKLFKSDIRSMINFMQSNQDIVKQSINYDKDINDNENDINDINDNDINENKLNCNIIEDKIWENILLMIREERKLTEINCYIHEISKNYNIDKKNIIKNFFNYIIRNNVITLTGQFLNFIENITHTQNINNNIYVNYSISSLYKFIKA